MRVGFGVGVGVGVRIRVRVRVGARGAIAPSRRPWPRAVG